MYNTVAAAEASGSPARTWVFKTDADGYVNLTYADSLFVSGDDLYYDEDGHITLPLGTILIQETKAPTGYQLNSTVFLRQITDDGSNAETVNTFNVPEIPETVSLGHLEITKAAEDGVKAGFRFRITGPSYPDGVVKTTDADGTISLQSIRAGAYTVEEIDVPGRYTAPANNPRTVTVTFNATATTAYENKLVRGSVQLTKTDAATGESGQGDASVAGIRFALVNESSYAVRYNDVDYATGEVVAILSLGADGTAATASKSLPYGDYTVYELRQDATIAAGESYEGSTKLGASELANDCYLFAENSKSVSVREDGQQVTAAFTNEAVRGGLWVRKRDAESGEAAPFGSATLEGAKIEIVNSSAMAIVYKGETIDPGEVVDVIVTDADGVAKTGDSDLPYGTYTLRETKAPTGYVVNSDWNATVEVREGGVLVELDTDHTLYDRVIRGDIHFVKVNGLTMERIANAAFRMTSKTTGESHIITTDANGNCYTSGAINPRDAETLNANDAAVDAEGNVDEDALNPDAGVWFTGGNSGSVADDSIGAFPYDTYIIEELRSSANEGLDLVTFEVTIYKDGVDIDLGTVDDNGPMRPCISTILLDKDTKLHMAAASKETALADEVRYYNVVAGESYTLNGILVDPDTEEPVLVNGEPVTAEKTFTATGEAGVTTLEFRFDASALGGTHAVAVVTLSQNNKELFVHDNLTNEEETVWFPGIDTVATGENGEKLLPASETLVIVDTIAYTGLEPNVTYTLRSSLVNKATGEVVRDDTGAVVVTTTFKPETADGTVEVRFEFDASKLAGLSLVAYEYILRGDILIASHADIDDDDQTVTIPEVTTTATVDGKHMAVASETTKLVDVVNYAGLEAGKTYTVKGVLMVKSSGKELTGTDGKPVTAEKTFTAPESGAGEVKLTFEFDSSLLKGETVVAFERVYEGEEEVVAHTDIDDEGQSVHFPKILTSASDGISGTKLLSVCDKDGTAKIVDEVSYSNLIPGLEYRLDGLLVDKETKKPLMNGEEQITAELVFTAEAASGKANVEFTFPIEVGFGKTIVVFETLSQAKAVVAEHKDIDDPEQTVEVVCNSKLYKYDASTEQPLAGAEFEIRDLTDSHAAVQKAVSGEDGYVNFVGIPGHEYEILEMKAPDGYDRSNTKYRVKVAADGTLTGDVNILNVHTGTVVIHKVDVITGDPLADCEIVVYAANGKEIFRQTTDERGCIYVYVDGGLKPGKYKYKETVSCGGYYVNTDIQEFEIAADGTVSGKLTLGNVPHGTAVIQKTDESQNPVKGAEISIYDDTGKFLGKGTTGANGRVYFVSPGPGRYYFLETKAPRGYIANKDKHYFEIASDYTITGELTFINVLDNDHPLTGDTSALAFWAAATALSILSLGGIGLWYLLVYRKRLSETAA